MKEAATRWFRVGGVTCKASGIEVEVDADLSLEEREKAIYEVVAEYLDYSYDEIDGPNGKPV